MFPLACVCGCMVYELVFLSVCFVMFICSRWLVFLRVMYFVCVCVCSVSLFVYFVCVCGYACLFVGLFAWHALLYAACLLLMFTRVVCLSRPVRSCTYSCGVTTSTVAPDVFVFTYRSAFIPSISSTALSFATLPVCPSSWFILQS